MEPVDDPMVEFAAWFETARSDHRVGEPAAMTLATATRDGRPSARMVLLRGLDRDGVVFFTNYESRKGVELDANPRAALVLHWQPLGRQVRVEGPVARLDARASDDYFATRARGSQLSAWASPQSRPVAARADLLAAAAEHGARFPAPAPVPRPPHWGGYRVAVEAIEFWEHRDDRLHERLRYTAAADRRWRVERLGP